MGKSDVFRMIDKELFRNLLCYGPEAIVAVSKATDWGDESELWCLTNTRLCVACLRPYQGCVHAFWAKFSLGLSNPFLHNSNHANDTSAYILSILHNFITKSQVLFCYFKPNFVNKLKEKMRSSLTLIRMLHVFLLVSELI